MTGRRSDAEKSTGLTLTPCQVCTALESQPILDRIRTIRYGSPVELPGGAVATLLDAGHVPGSASILLDVPSGTGRSRLLFSGDLGNRFSDLIEGPAPAPAVDTVWVESTYGSAQDFDPTAEKTDFRSAISTAVSSRRIVWIPAFALDRTQKVLYQLRMAQTLGTLPPSVPVFALSPSGRAITDLYLDELRSKRDTWFRAPIYSTPPVFASFYQQLPDKIPTPSIIVTSSGMMDLGTSAGLLEELLPRQDVTVLQVGYQDPESVGGIVQKGVSALTSEQYTGPGRATVRRFKAFSAHADSDEVIRWLSNQSQSTPIRLVHGNAENLRNQAAALSASGFTDVTVVVPEQSTSVPLAARVNTLNP